MKHNNLSLQLLITGLCTAVSISLVGCDEHLGSGTNTSNQPTNTQNITSGDATLKSTHCFYPDDDSCGNMTMVELDNIAPGIHQVMKGNYDKGNVVALDTPMLMKFSYDQPWNAQDMDQYISYNFGYSWNLKKDSVKITFTDTPESGCLSKTTIAPNEICYMYATIHMEPESTTLETKRNLVSASTRFTEHKGTTTLFQLSTTFRYEDVSQSIRNVMPWEKQYLTPQTQDKQYQVIRLQNISANPSKVLEIQPNGIILESGLNNIFQLQHRTTSGDDPLYGNLAECTIPDKVNNQLKQVTSLARSEECFLVYKAVESVDKAGSYQDKLIITTNAQSSPNRNPDMARYAPSSFDRPVTPKMNLSANYKSEDERQITGIRWNRSSQIQSRWRTVYYANGVWVAGSNGSGLWWSKDGKDWIQSNQNSSNWYNVYYADGVWVAGGYLGIYWSTDGKNWIQSNSYGGSRGTIAYESGLWVIGNDGNNGLWWSKNGKIWEHSNQFAGKWYSISKYNGLWLAGGVSDVYSSVDGKTWNQRNVRPSATFNSFDYNNGNWIVASNIGLFSSTDGDNWAINITGAWNTVSFAKNIWVAAGNIECCGVKWSVDGKIWTQSNLSIGSADYSTYFLGDAWIALSSSRGIWWSSDGKSWYPSSQVTGNWSSIYYANGVLVAVSANNSDIIYGTIEYYEPRSLLQFFNLSPDNLDKY